MNNKQLNIHAQHGATLLLLVLVLIVVGAGFLLSTSNVKHAERKALNKSYQTAEEIKLSLIGRAASDQNRPGSLSCPDVDGDGDAESSVIVAMYECPSWIGLFPYRTIDRDVSNDYSGNRIWYALSPDFQDEGGLSGGVLNDTTPAQLTVDGNGDIVAILIFPGPVLAAQAGTRDAVSADWVADINAYLEGENADEDNDYLTGVESDTFNDQLVVLTRTELMDLVVRRVAAEANTNNWCTTSPGTGHWFCDNEWDDQASVCGSNLGACP